MKTLCQLVTLLLSLSLFQSTATAANDPRVDEILRKHQEAMGGLRNWHNVESIRLSGTVERDGQIVDIVIIKKRPNQIRATITVPIPNKEDEFIQVIRAHDGKNAWSATRLAGAHDIKKEKLSEEAAAELLVDVGVLPRLIKLWREGEELRLLNSKTINGTNCRVIEVRPENELNQYTFYISKEDHLVTHYESHHPVNGTTTTRLSEYVSEQNVLIPTINIVEAEHTGRSILTTTSIKIGIGIYDEYFEASNPLNTAKL